MSHLKIGLFGFGCVGSGLYQVLNQNNQLNAKIVKIVAKDPTKSRENTTVPILYDTSEILNDSEINVVVGNQIEYIDYRYHFQDAQNNLKQISALY